MRRPWWLFYGVAAETERMRYRGPWERFALAVRAVTVAYTEAMVPAFRQVAKAINDFGRALSGSRVPVPPSR